MEVWDSMFHYYQRNLELSETTGADINLIYAHYNLAVGYQKNEIYDKAKYHFEKCVDLSLIASSKLMTLHSYIGLADIAYQNGRYREGLAYLAKMDKEEMAYDLIHDQEEMRSRIYKKLGNYQQAFLSLEKYMYFIYYNMV